MRRQLCFLLNWKAVALKLHLLFLLKQLKLLVSVTLEGSFRGRIKGRFGTESLLLLPILPPPLPPWVEKNQLKETLSQLQVARSGTQLHIAGLEQELTRLKKELNIALVAQQEPEVRIVLSDTQQCLMRAQQ
ncbi:unnamed protein product [Dibothriocephalus latus]|uniref:Uncharacterized protein n=1 Tax=Dibothriocephalus latus TaxID=60516 RepID=A0A3P7NVR4_DIBLA|nr:unnamed protein product [Dibothriocephalus latus]